MTCKVRYPRGTVVQLDSRRRVCGEVFAIQVSDTQVAPSALQDLAEAAKKNAAKMKVQLAHIACYQDLFGVRCEYSRGTKVDRLPCAGLSQSRTCIICTRPLCCV